MQEISGTEQQESAIDPRGHSRGDVEARSHPKRRKSPTRFDEDRKKIVTVGDPLPTPGTFTHFLFPVLNDVGQVPFAAADEAAGAAGIFLASGATFAKVVVKGDPTPMGGTVDDVDSPPALNNKGEVAFRATISGGPAKRGIFVAAGGMIHKVVAEGDPSPSGGSFTFPRDEGFPTMLSVAGFCLDDAGRLSFPARQGFFLAVPAN